MLPSTPRSNLALENPRRSGGPPAHPVIPVSVVGDYLAEGAIAINARRAVTYVNRLAVALLGVPPAALTGRDVLTLLGPSGDPGRRFERAITDVLQRGIEQVLTVNATDTVAPFNVDYCRLVPIADGGALILLGETMSPSVPEELAKARALAAENARLVADLERRAARLSAVAKVQLAMSRTHLPEIYAEVYRAVASAISDVSCFALLLADQAASMFRPQLVVVGGVVTRSAALPAAPFAECSATTAFRIRQPVISDSPARAWDALVRGAASPAAPACEVAAPIIHGERALGVLIVQSTRHGVFTADDVELLSIIAGQAGAAIDNARFFESRRDERELANAAARAEERRIAEHLRQSEKLAALGELVAGVAHELNNPLAGISAFAQLLLEEPLDDDQLESARLIKREADRAVGVIRDLLIFSRKEGRSDAAVDVNALVQLTLRLRAYSLRASRVEVVTDLGSAIPEVAGDDQKLQQVILNLVVNAEHAMRESATRRLVIRTTREDESVLIEVSDTGAGMADETLRRVFEPFFTTKPPGEGTGLGLSVSYSIVEAHGGTISVESALERGTTFRVRLPVRAGSGAGGDQE